MSNKPKIMLHYVRPGTTGGPNVSFQRIQRAPFLCEKYFFVPLNQKRAAGGTINFGLIFELKREIEKVKPDIIHISGMQNAGFHCMIAAVFAGCKRRIISTRGFSGDALGSSGIKRFVFNYIIEPLTIVLAARVQGISKYTTEKAMVQKYAKNKTCYIYNLPPNPTEMCNRKYVRDQLGIRSEEIVFTTVSRIVIDKGYKQLAEAIRRLNDVSNIRYLIVGDGEYEHVFRKNIKDEIDCGKVLMLGKRNDVMNILAESNVFVLPTLHENFGNVFVEASSVGIPSIASNVGGVPEIITDGDTGLLVSPDDSQALSDAIYSLYKNNDLRKRMGQNANNKFCKTFDSELLEKQYDELYQSLLFV